jgi:hypothetical protein
MGRQQVEEAAEANALMREFLDREARGLDPITGAAAAGGRAVPWVRGDKETWILTLIADYKRHFAETGNPCFMLAAFSAADFLPDRATHAAALAWVDLGLRAFIKALLAGGNPFSVERGRRSLPAQARRRLRDDALALAVLNRLPIERDNETLAIAYVAQAEKLSTTVVGDAWRDLKARRHERH